LDIGKGIETESCEGFDGNRKPRRFRLPDAGIGEQPAGQVD